MAEKTMVRNGGTATGPETTRSSRFFAPRVDIFETDTELLLIADLPGVRPQDVDLRYERGELILRGKVASPTPQGQPAIFEYETGDFHRVFQIHETIDATKIDAEFKNGVLTVHLPKQESAKPKQVKIRTN
jgi:HSP20 family protein